MAIQQYPNRAAALADFALGQLDLWSADLSTIGSTVVEDNKIWAITGASASSLVRAKLPGSFVSLPTDIARIAAAEAAIADLQAVVASLPEVPVRAAYLFDTLSNLNAIDRHAANVYAMTITGSAKYKSNGTDTWAVTTDDIVVLAANNGVAIRGNVSVEAAQAYLAPLGADGVTYEVLAASIFS